MMPRFTDELRALAGSKWDAVVEHRFTDELAAGTIADGVLARYLIQDHRFLDAFVVLLASMIAAAPTLADRIPGCQFLALITGRENTYFERSFDALGVDRAAREDTPNAPPTSAFDSLMREAAKASYPEMLAVLVVAEWRCSWAHCEGYGTPTPLALTLTAWVGEASLGEVGLGAAGFTTRDRAPAPSLAAQLPVVGRARAASGGAGALHLS